MAGTSIIDRLGYGPLEAIPQFFSSAALSTTPVKVTLPTPTSGASRPLGVKIKIVNGDAANVIAWTLVKNGAAAPTVTADYAATCGSIITAGQAEYFSLSWGGDPAAMAPWFDLYVVANGASTEVNVTFSLIC